MKGNPLAEKLELRRRQLGVSREQLRKDMGAGSTQITNVFNGRWEGLTWITIDRVREALGLTYEDWFDIKSPESAARDALKQIGTSETGSVHAKLDEVLSLLRAEQQPALELMPTKEQAPAVVPPRRSGKLSIGVFGKAAAGFGSENAPRQQPH